MNEYDDSKKPEDEEHSESESLELERNDVYANASDQEDGADSDDHTSEPDVEDDGIEVEAVDDDDNPEFGESDDSEAQLEVETEVESIPEPDAYENHDEEAVEPALETAEPALAVDSGPVPEPGVSDYNPAGISVEPGAAESVQPGEPVNVKPETFGMIGMSILLLVAIAGCALRVLLYLKEPALWLDEAALVVQVLSRSMGELTEPLTEHHSAPVGFLIVSKMLINAIGTDELGLRAFPLGASIVGLLTTAWLARKSMHVVGAVLAVGIVALSWPAIGYAAEFKQYSSDLMTASIVFLLGYGVLVQPSSRSRLIVFALAGAILQWFSLPVLFVLAGVGLVAGIDALSKGETKKAGGLALVALVWAGSFAGNYFVALKHTAADATLQSWHVDAFMMFPPDRAWPAALKWMGWTFMDTFENPVGLVLPGLGMVGFLCGSIVIARKNSTWLLMLLAPMVVMLIASYLQRYPVHGRFMQFLIPALVVVVGTGLGEIVRLLWEKRQRVFAGIVVFAIFVQPIAIAANELLNPTDDGIRPVVEYLANGYEEGDGLYLHFWVRDEYDYHSDQLGGVPLETAYVGASSRNDWSWYATEIMSLGGNETVWFVLVEDDSHLAIGERKFFETELNRVGAPLDYQRWGIYHLYAYDLSGVTPVPLPEGSMPEPAPEPKLESESQDAPEDVSEGESEGDESGIDDSAENVEPVENE